jgi:hypothetical protein
MFREFSISKKYSLALAIVGGFFLFYYLPMLQSPDYLYHTNEVNEFRSIRTNVEKLTTQLGRAPTVSEVQASVMAGTEQSTNGYKILSSDERRDRIEGYLNYLSNPADSVMLVLKPLYMNVIYMSILATVFSVLFFGYQFVKDPPQSAYLERIMFMMLLISSLEIIQNWSNAHLVGYSTLLVILRLGGYISAAPFLVLVVIFVLRLRFITSVSGEFYESELQSSPADVARMRDGLDNLLLRHFVARSRSIQNQLFVVTNKNSSTDQ